MRKMYSNAKSRQQMKTFCWLGILSVLLETVEEGAEVMWRKREVGRLLGRVIKHQALLSEGVEPSWDWAQNTHQQNCQKQLQHSRIIFSETDLIMFRLPLSLYQASRSGEGGTDIEQLPSTVATESCYPHHHQLTTEPGRNNNSNNHREPLLGTVRAAMFLNIWQWWTAGRRGRIMPGFFSGQGPGNQNSTRESNGNSVIIIKLKLMKLILKKANFSSKTKNMGKKTMTSSLSVIQCYLPSLPVCI